MIDFRRLDGRADFYFLRHGRSEGNSAGIIQGRRDYPLADRGREQAVDVSGWLKERGIQRVLSSPLKRARETAAIVAGALGLEEPAALPELTELDTGLFTGLAVAEVEERHPDQWRSFQARSWEGVQGAETVAALIRRAESLWDVLAEELEQGFRTVLCVTHSGIMQWIVKVTFGHRDWMPLIPMDNCAVSQFTLDNHLGDELLRYYFQWSRLSYQPSAAPGPDGNAVSDELVRR